MRLDRSSTSAPVSHALRSFEQPRVQQNVSGPSVVSIVLSGP